MGERGEVNFGFGQHCNQFQFQFQLDHTYFNYIFQLYHTHFNYILGQHCNQFQLGQHRCDNSNILSSSSTFFARVRINYIKGNMPTSFNCEHHSCDNSNILSFNYKFLARIWGGEGQFYIQATCQPISIGPLQSETLPYKNPL